jgi:hypothetical protein
MEFHCDELNHGRRRKRNKNKDDNRSSNCEQYCSCICRQYTTRPMMILILLLLTMSTFSTDAEESVPVDSKRTDTSSNSSDDDDPWNMVTKFLNFNLFDDTNKEQVVGPGSKSQRPVVPVVPKFWEIFRSSDDSKQKEKEATNFETTQWNQILQSISTMKNPFVSITATGKGSTGIDDGTSKPVEPNNAETTQRHHQYDALTELIESISSSSHHVVNKQDISLPNIINLFWATIQKVHQQLEGTFKSILDLVGPLVNPLQVYYYMLQQEIVHNPVYKRRQHAYHTEVSEQIAIQFGEGLYLSQLAYVNDCATIQKHLSAFHNNSWIVINCTTTRQPFQPAHFLAIRRSGPKSNANSWNYTMDSNMKNQQSSSTSWASMLLDNLFEVLNLTNSNSNNGMNIELEAMLVISGTKDIADMMSDALLEPTKYGNMSKPGMTHNGIYQSAMYIHDTYRTYLEQLLYKTNRSKLKLWLIGHSLGGGTAALACLEFNKPYKSSTSNATTTTASSQILNYDGNVNSNDNHTNFIPQIDAYALGFGTPAVLSKEYSELARSKVTTVINDADCVPRMSGATLVNLLLNIATSNHWVGEAQIDIQQLTSIMKEKLPFPDDWIDTVMKTINNWVVTSDVVNATMRRTLSEKIATPILYPPGECIHMFRDGTAWQGVYYPCTNFKAIEGVRYMVDDHLIPEGYYRGLLGYIRNMKRDLNWQFVNDLTRIPV